MMLDPPDAAETGESRLQLVCSESESNLKSGVHRTTNQVTAEQPRASAKALGVAKAPTLS